MMNKDKSKKAAISPSMFADVKSIAKYSIGYLLNHIEYTFLVCYDSNKNPVTSLAVQGDNIHGYKIRRSKKTNNFYYKRKSFQPDIKNIILPTPPDRAFIWVREKIMKLLENIDGESIDNSMLKKMRYERLRKPIKIPWRGYYDDKTEFSVEVVDYASEASSLTYCPLCDDWYGHSTQIMCEHIKSKIGKIEIAPFDYKPSLLEIDNV